ncbi:MAG TPA: SDR family oxidoreductase [Bacteroides sp.]|nr:SDR family oxidoreductase [Bacteroides sp.]
MRHAMVILITGASRGIGAALAGRLTGSGHTVLAVSRNRKGLQRIADECNQQTGKRLCHPIPFDLTDLTDLEEEFRSTVMNHAATVDALVNNAGHMIHKPFRQFTLREARNLFETNFFAPAQLIRIILPMMADSSLRHVVNITSMGGFQGSAKFSGLSYYSASKAALGNLTECLAEELGEEGIRVNALALGSVQTEMLAEAFPGYRAPLKPDQMAGFLQWFILEGAGYFNGKILPVSISTP